MDQRLHWASEQWVKGQRDYFARAIKRDEWREQRTVWFKWGFVVVGLVLVFISLFVLHRLGLWGHGLLLVGAGLCPVAAALIHGHAEKRALAQHVKQYDRMHHLFATEQPDLEKRLDDATTTVPVSSSSSFAISAARPWPRTATGSSSTATGPLKSSTPVDLETL